MCDMGVYIDTVFLSNSIVKVEVNTSSGVGYQSYYCIVQQPLLSSSVCGESCLFLEAASSFVERIICSLLFHALLIESFNIL